MREWCHNPARAKARYGPIGSWDTSMITDMEELFLCRNDFNEDISQWNVSNVVTMNHMFRQATSFNGDLSCWDLRSLQYTKCMFWSATSFDRQLSGAWSTKYLLGSQQSNMFMNSPGTIAGKTKDANGNIR